MMAGFFSPITITTVRASRFEYSEENFANFAGNSHNFTAVASSANRESCRSRGDLSRNSHRAIKSLFFKDFRRAFLAAARS
jgi:hypothetical protein